MNKNKGYRKYIRDRMSEIIQLMPISSKPELKLIKATIDKKKIDPHEDDTTIMHNGSKEALAQKNRSLKQHVSNSKEGNPK